jgi:hypothetical protein
MIGLLRGSGVLASGVSEAWLMGVSLPRLSVVHLRRRRSVLAVLAAVAIVLELAAGTGLAFVAGWSRVRAVLGDFDGRWLIALAGALLVSFVGYHYAYRGNLPRRRRPRAAAPADARCGRRGFRRIPRSWRRRA